MKIKTRVKSNLIEEGKNNWENTDEFNKKINEIRRDLSQKYLPILSNEKNWFKRLLIRIRFWREKSKKIDELSSWKNLHLVSSQL